MDDHLPAPGATGTDMADNAGPPGLRPRVLARFVPQAWVRDWAVTVDAEGDIAWDVTLEVIEAGAAFDWRDDDQPSDDLRGVPTAPTWVRDWGGPFYVVVQDAAADFWHRVREDAWDVAAIRAACEAERAAATPAAGRPGPLGGVPPRLPPTVFVVVSTWSDGPPHVEAFATEAAARAAVIESIAEYHDDGGERPDPRIAAIRAREVEAARADPLPLRWTDGCADYAITLGEVTVAGAG